MRHRSFANSAAALALAGIAVLAACSGHGGSSALPGTSQTLPMPKSESPGSIAPAPMAKTEIQPASAMGSVAPDSSLQALGWSQIPGTAVQVSASADGSLWVLSNQPAGPDKYIWHYVNGVWTNISGQASQISAAANGTLYAINSGGGTYAYKNGGWTSLGGGASYVTAAFDGSVYVLSNAGPGPDRAIWHNVNNVWTQVGGSGTALSASWDWGTYTVPGGTLSPNGLWIINSAGGIYYENTNGTFAQLSGAATSITSTTSGGVFALGYPANASGTGLYYNDLATGSWAAQPGSGVSVSSNGQALYVVNAAGAIYKTGVNPVAAPTPGATIAPGDFVSGTSGKHYWGPGTTANAFQFPVQSGYSGTRETVAIVIDAVPNMNDLTTYLSFFGIHRTGQISTRPVDGGGPMETTSGGEASLDSETIAGIAPGADVIIYNIPDLSFTHIDDAYNAILSDGRANVVSLSFGGCEYSGVRTIENPIFNQMNAAGIAVVASSGDTGNSCYFSSTSTPPGVESPASDPNVISVGGTQTFQGATPVPAQTPNIVTNAIWNDCAGATQGQNCMSGGGVSTFFTPPPYQVGLSGTINTGRNVPDISLPGNGDILRLVNGWYGIGGTSWSAPLAAAMVSQIYQYCNVTSMPNAVKMFYNTFSAQGYSAFYDVTVGNDAYFTNTSPSYSAAAGYDLVGGIGQPLGMHVAAQICPGHVFSPLSTGVVASAIVRQLPAEARAFDNVRDLRGVAGVADLGPRAADAPTRIGVQLRATTTQHADEAAVVSELRAAGFTITQRFPNAMLVDAQAPAATVARYFGTTFHDYAQQMHGTRFANTTPLTIPAGIAPYVQGVISDDLVTRATPPLHLEPLTGVLRQ